MAKSEIVPADGAGVVKALEFIEGTITLTELNRWAQVYSSHPGAADRDSHVVARLVRVLHGAYGEQFLSPVFNVLSSVHATPQEVDDVVMRVALEYAAAAPTPPQA